MSRKVGWFYGRVSASGQKDGFSLEVQLDAGLAEAKRRGAEIAEEDIWIEVHSASTLARRRRPKFLEMMEAARVRRPDFIFALLQDRLGGRRPEDVEDLIQLSKETGVEIIFVRGAVNIGPRMRAAEKMQVRVQGTFDTYYSEVLGERLSDSLQKKVETGMWPTFARYGYRNVRRAGEGAVIEPDPDQQRYVRELMELYASGDYDLEDLTAWARQRALKTTLGKPLGRGNISRILTEPHYHGVFRWKGQTYPAAYPALVTPELWERVQAVRRRRNGGERKRRSAMPYAQLLRCGECGAAVSWQQVTNRHRSTYLYGRCTGRLGPCSQRKYVRQEVIEEALHGHLRQLRLADDVAELLRASVQDLLREGRTDEDGERRAVEARLEDVGRQLIRTTDLRARGELDAEGYWGVVAELRAERAALEGRVEELKGARRSREVDEDAVLEVLDYAQGVSVVWEKLAPTVRRRVADLVFEGLTWANGVLEVQWRPAWEALRVPTLSDAALDAAGAGVRERLDAWLSGAVPTLPRVAPGAAQDPPDQASGGDLGEPGPESQRGLRLLEPLVMAAAELRAAPELRPVVEACRELRAA